MLCACARRSGDLDDDALAALVDEDTRRQLAGASGESSGLTCLKNALDGFCVVAAETSLPQPAGCTTARGDANPPDEDAPHASTTPASVLLAPAPRALVATAAATAPPISATGSSHARCAAAAAAEAAAKPSTSPRALRTSACLRRLRGCLPPHMHLRFRP